MSPVIDPVRLDQVKDVPLSTGKHDAPGEGCAPGAFCVMEKFAYVTGQRWTDHPQNCSPVIGAMLRSFNDRTDDHGRAMLDGWVFDNAERLVATAGDGHDRARGFIAADHSVRTVLPIWLDVAGATDAAEQLRGRGEIVDADAATAARDAVREIRKGLPYSGDYWEWRRQFVAKVREAVVAAVKAMGGSHRHPGELRADRAQGADAPSESRSDPDQGARRTMSDYRLSPEEAMRRLDVIRAYDSGSGIAPHVHTLVQAPFGLAGAHWPLTDVEFAFRRYGAEEAGDEAKKMKHGVVVPHYERFGGPTGAVFFATRDTARDACPRCGHPGYVSTQTGDHLCGSADCENAAPIPDGTHSGGTDG